MRVVAGCLLALLLFMSLGGGEADHRVLSCRSFGWFGTSQVVPVTDGEAVVIHVRLDQPLPKGIFGIPIPLARLSSNGANSVYLANERGMIGAFVETGDGSEVRYQYGLRPGNAQTRVEVAGQRVVPQGVWCDGVSVGLGDHPPGEYRIVAFATSDAHSEFSIDVADVAVITRVWRGASVSLMDHDLPCASRVEAVAASVGVRSFTGCAKDVEATSRLYWTGVVGQQPDETHDAHWVTPIGETIQLTTLAQFGRGEPGAWSFRVPQYGNPGADPVDGYGVMGVAADVPMDA